MLRSSMIAVGLIAPAGPLGAQDTASYKREFLGELAYASRNVIALAKAMPAEKYGWRPGDGVRSVSEVYMHIVTANFELLDIVGQPLPEDLYGKVELTGRARSICASWCT